MKTRKYLNSQSGAALILVLFAVLFLSIVGTVLLNATTYNFNSSVKNVKVQEEFYAGEGAVDLVLDEMETYKGKIIEIILEDKNGVPVKDRNGQPILKKVQLQGPYYFIEDKRVPFTLTKTVGEETINISVSKVNGAEDQYKLSARYSNKESNVSRELVLKVKKGEKPTIKSDGGSLISPIYYSDNLNYNGSTNHDDLDFKGNSKKISHQLFNTILKNVGFPVTYDNLWQINNSYTFSTGKNNPNKIDLSGNGNTVIVPSGTTAFVKNVDLKGSGNTDVQILIDGILVVEDFNMSGNATVVINGALIVTSNININGGGNNDSMVINSGLVAKNIATSGKNNFSGDAKGIDCTLLGLTGEICSRSADPDTFIPEDNPWTSSMEITKYDTLRH